MDLENVKGLLNDFFGFGAEDAEGFPIPSDKDIRVLIPVTTSHLSDGLHTVLDWTEYADLPFEAVTDENDKASKRIDRVLADAETTFPGGDPSLDLIDLLEEAGTTEEAVLILLWGEGEDDETYRLLELADQREIPVLDLTGGLDDLNLKAPEEPVVDADPEPEPEPEPEAPARGRRAKAEQQDVEDVEQSDETPAPKTRGRARAAAEEPVAGVATLDDQISAAGRTATAKVDVAVNSEHLFTKEFVIAALDRALSPTTAAAGEPSVIGIFEEPKAYLLYPEDGHYEVRGRGRKPVDADAVWLTPSMVAALGDRAWA